MPMLKLQELEYSLGMEIAGIQAGVLTVGIVILEGSKTSTCDACSVLVLYHSVLDLAN